MGKPLRSRSRAAPAVPSAVREALRTTFLERSTALLDRLSKQASPRVLREALAAPTDLGGMATLLSHTAALGVDLRTADPLAEAMARGAARRAELLQQAGGALGVSAVGKLLGLTRQGVEKRRRAGHLLAVESGSGDWRYPACQFAPDHPRGVLKGLEDYLGAFTVPDGWTQLSVLLTPARSLRGRTCLEALQQGDVAGAVAVARTFGEHGA